MLKALTAHLQQRGVAVLCSCMQLLSETTALLLQVPATAPPCARTCNALQRNKRMPDAALHSCEHGPSDLSWHMAAPHGHACEYYGMHDPAATSYNHSVPLAAACICGPAAGALLSGPAVATALRCAAAPAADHYQDRHSQQLSALQNSGQDQMLSYNIVGMRCKLHCLTYIQASRSVQSHQPAAGGCLRSWTSCSRPCVLLSAG
jgi:hypothetical protein